MKLVGFSFAGVFIAFFDELLIEFAVFGEQFIVIFFEEAKLLFKLANLLVFWVWGGAG